MLARFTATYDLLFTRRLIAQPRIEVNAVVQNARHRLRKLGDTADLARANGEEVDALGVVVGIRLWF